MRSAIGGEPVNGLSADSPIRDAGATPEDCVEAMERLIRRDPARRGLIASEPLWGRLCPNHLLAAARSLVQRPRQAALVTGFFVPAGDPASAETDGPLGAACLARVLKRLGWTVQLITDHCCLSALRVAVEASGLAPDCVIALESRTAQRRWLGRNDGNLSHLIAVERVGPSHTLRSVRRQPGWSEQLAATFEECVPEAARGRCHNMRGSDIDAWTAPLHALFEDSRRLEVRTIGIGDGGNEIGMGAIDWGDLRRRLQGPQAGRIVCRVATDWNIIAGTSNWGALALAAAVAVLDHRTEVLAEWTRARHRAVLEDVVQHGPAVDGVTGRQEPTVDGLPFLTYIQPWESILELLGLDPLTGDSPPDGNDGSGDSPPDQNECTGDRPPDGVDGTGDSPRDGKDYTGGGR